MKTLKFLSTLTVVAMMMVTSCKTPDRHVSRTMSVISAETVSLGYNGDGTIVVRAWGAGKNKGDAIEQAMRNAVHDIVFTGVKGTNPGPAAKALVSEVNAEERYSNYFEPFFSPSGEYRKFVSEESTQTPRLQSSGEAWVGYGVVLIVDRGALRNQLVADSVLAK